MWLHVMQCMVLPRPFFPSVCPSVNHEHCGKMKETCVHILTPHERTFILVFRHEEWLVGSTLCTEILSNTDPPIRAKTLIFKQYLLVTPQP